MRPPSRWNFFGILEKCDDLLDFVLCLINTRNVCEGDLVLGVVEHARLRLAERHRLAPPA